MNYQFVYDEGEFLYLKRWTYSLLVHLLWFTPQLREKLIILDWPMIKISSIARSRRRVKWFYFEKVNSESIIETRYVFTPCSPAAGTFDVRIIYHAQPQQIQFIYFHTFSFASRKKCTKVKIFLPLDYTIYISIVCKIFSATFYNESIQIIIYSMRLVPC